MLQAIKRQLNQVGSCILAYALQVLDNIQLTKVQTIQPRLSRKAPTPKAIHGQPLAAYMKYWTKALLTKTVSVL